jgi:hypothetical protein
MKENMQRVIFRTMVFATVLTGFAATAGANTCGRGLAEPPFLSFGIDSNLLMMLDNSGSMLDMAYISPDTDCFDQNFVAYDSEAANPSIYAGNFTVLDDTGEVWYKWVETIQPWKTRTYIVGDRVYENGVIYVAKSVTGVQSNGTNIYEDKQVIWEPLLRPTWENNTTYHPKSFVFDPNTGKLYFTEYGGTANGESILGDGIAWTEISTWRNNTYYPADTYVLWEGVIYHTFDEGTSSGTKPWDDTGLEWFEVDPFQWEPGIAYAAGNIVTHDGMIFEAQAGYLQNTTALTIYEDDFDTNWSRIDDGYFEKVSRTDALAVCSSAQVLDTANNTMYTSSDLCLTVSRTATPEEMVAFAASGNMLNWLMASKFDIQKNILTGGKYIPEAQRLISENRGCSGSRFTKQVLLNSGQYLVMTVRGTRGTDDPLKRDKVGMADDSGRLEILAISSTGYNPGACQEAVDWILEKGLEGSQNLVDACLDGPGSTADARTALNHAMQYCWADDTTRNLNTIVGDCVAVYNSIPPNYITTFDNAYNCYGIYDEYLVHNVDRVGYAGRCWAPGTTTGGSTCDPVTRDITKCDWTAESPCEFWDGSSLLRYTSDYLYTEICTQLNNAGTACQNNAKWTLYFADSSSGLHCDPTDPAYAEGTSAGWSSELDGDPMSSPDAYGIPPVINNTGLTDQAFWCFYEAMEDYCRDLRVPQVIDPSEQSTTTTGDLGNIPAVLIESGVLNRLGIDIPMYVMKGYALQSTQPIGILHKNATELRIGAMAFNSVGAYTECQGVDTSDRIDEYCPRTNKDGAQVITPIRIGSLLTEDVNDNGTFDEGEDRRHVDNLVAAINAVRATSWTPLAEAMYTAIGYYTQNQQVRLHETDFQTDADVFAGWQSGREYAPGTYLMDGSFLYHTVLGGRSLGSSREDDTGVIWHDIGEYLGIWSDGAVYDQKSIVSSDGKLYVTYSGGTAIQKPESPGGPLYDEGVLWEPLLDPVANWCQDNHILVITEGASTTDISGDLIDFVAGSHIFNTEPIADPGDTASDGQCTDGLDGSTYFDDLVYFARNRYDPADEYSSSPFDLYPSNNDSLPSGDYPYLPMAKRSLKTSIVVAGSLRDDTAGGECNPAVLMTSAADNSGTPLMRGENPDELEANLLAFFNDLRQRASAGSAASVISSARGGEGAIYQAIFWPERKSVDSEGNTSTITWVGDVHGLFLNDLGEMFEDSNGNRVLDPSIEQGDGGDQRVVIYYDEDQNRAMACRAPDENGICGEVVEITEVKYLWSANDWLSDNAMNTAANRANYISSEKRRHIFTWNDLNNNGIVDDGEIIDLETSVDWVGDFTESGGRGAVVRDFGLGSDAEVDMVVSWLRGNDWLIDETVELNDLNGNGVLDRPQRSRWDGTRTWRLGDIIHSTPMTVSNPAEGYHLIYNDFSYAQFLSKYRGRRHMIYFGANDGFLHAVNAGFYSERDKKFCLVPLTNGTCDESILPVNGVPELGAEMWAYLPYNLQPHVKCLTEPNYVHKYFVDQRPRIFDVQIFEEEGACRDLENNPTFSNDGCNHPNGWGTILVGGMRFGGTSIRAPELNGNGADNREFISSYFILDITNPEEPPVLLGELSRRIGEDDVNLGYSTVIPTMIIMKDSEASTPVNKWYLLFGSGPHDDYAQVETNRAVKGISSQQARVSVLPLDWLTTNKTGLRIPALDLATSSTSESGTFYLDRSPNGFVSDMVTVDFDINPSYREYKADAAYFGTVQGDFIADGTGQRWACIDEDGDGQCETPGGGIMYRLVIKHIGSNGSSFGAGAEEPVTKPWQWEIKPLIDLTVDNEAQNQYLQPITSAASVGTDNFNFWIYFGTGRFFDADDKTDRTQQAYYGIKEPIVTVDGRRYFTWDEVEIPATGTDPGNKGLLRVDEIQVGLRADQPAGSGILTCRDDSTGGCLPYPGVRDNPYLFTLENYISGTGQCTEAGNYSNCVDGWFKLFHPHGNRERNVGQATLLGGLVTFTTYQPFNDVCTAEGNAYLYGVYYRTGTAWHENIFGPNGVNSGNVVDRLYLGRGLATTPNLHVGSGDGSGGPKAFVQTSTGEILEIQQENLPIKNYQTGPSRWKEYTR